MRLLVLTSSWPLHPGDGRGGFVREWCETLARRGFEVVVAAPRPAEEDPVDPQGSTVRVAWLPALLPPRSKAFHGAGIESNLARHPGSLLGLPPFLSAFALEATVLATGCDAIVAHWLLPMGAVGAVVASMTGRPLRLVAHSGPPALARVPPLSGVVRSIAGVARSIACVSESVAREVRQVVGERARLVSIPLGIDLRPIVPVPPGRVAGRRVLFAGRLVPLKGVDVLLRAVAGLPDTDLTVAGEGPEGGRLHDLACRLGVQARFAGAMSREEVLDAMSAADLLAVPSRVGRTGRVEGLPRVIPEAWSCGLPVVATSAGGAGEALSVRGGGLLALPGDPGDLRRAIRAVLEDAELRRRLRDEAIAAAAALSWDVVGDRWADWVREG
mgnify:CR=1 FL=1